MGSPKDVRINDPEKKIWLDGQLKTENQTPDDAIPYPIYKDQQTFAAYYCYVFNGKLI
jgi:hypothetical protein